MRIVGDWGVARWRLLLVATGFKVESLPACREFTLRQERGKKAMAKTNNKTKWKNNERVSSTCFCSCIVISLVVVTAIRGMSCACSDTPQQRTA